MQCWNDFKITNKWEIIINYFIKVQSYLLFIYFICIYIYIYIIICIRYIIKAVKTIWLKYIFLHFKFYGVKPFCFTQKRICTYISEDNLKLLNSHSQTKGLCHPSCWFSYANQKFKILKIKFGITLFNSCGKYFPLKY
jgi:hypothetical protein